jgi:flagellar biosynthetic protein FliO
VIPFLLAQADFVGSGTPELMPSVWRMMFGLAVVLALVGGAAWLLRRGILTKRASGALGLESALSLGDRRSLVIVTVEGRRLLLGLAPNSVALVTELSAKNAFSNAVNTAIEKGPRS